MLLIWWHIIKAKVAAALSPATPAPPPEGTLFPSWVGAGELQTPAPVARTWKSKPYFIADVKYVNTISASGVPALTLTLDSWMQVCLQSIMQTIEGYLNPAFSTGVSQRTIIGLTAMWRSTAQQRVAGYPSTGIGADLDMLAHVYAQKQAALMDDIQTPGEQVSIWVAWSVR